MCHLPAGLKLVLAVVLSGAALRANMAPRIRPGQIIGEPAGALKSIRIERELLVIDLRPLADWKPAVVEATYEVRNGGEKQTVDLVFVAVGPGPEQTLPMWWEAQVRLGDQPIASRQTEPGELPLSWQSVHPIPLPNGEGSLDYTPKEMRTIQFSVTLPPGPETIRVRYEVWPRIYAGRLAPTVEWQLGYLLAPAREWGGFGRLDARIQCPPGWRAASEPRMKRQGNDLVGAWDGIPADAIGLIAQAPPGWGEWADSIVNASRIAGGLILCVVAGWLTGRWLGRRGNSSWRGVPVSLAAALLWAVGQWQAIILEIEVVKAAAGQQASWNYKSGDALEGRYLVPFVLLAGFVIAQAVVAMVCRRARRAARGPGTE